MPGVLLMYLLLVIFSFRGIYLAFQFVNHASPSLSPLPTWKNGGKENKVHLCIWEKRKNDSKSTLFLCFIYILHYWQNACIFSINSAEHRYLIYYFL